VGIRCTGKGRVTQRLEGFTFVLTGCAPLRIDGALGLGLALLGIEEDPAWRHAAIG